MSEWPMVKLGEVCDLNPRRDKMISGETMISFIEMKSLLENGSVLPVKTLAKQYLKGFSPFRNRDVLVAKITPCFQNNKIGLAEIGTDFGFGTTEFHVLRVHEKQLLPEYLTLFLRRQCVLIAGEASMTGSGGQRRVPKSFFENLQIPLPPLEEQKRIAEILGGVAEAIQKTTYEIRLIGNLAKVDSCTNVETQKLSEVVTIRSGTVDPTLDENRDLPHIAPDSIEKGTGKLQSVKTCAESGVTSGKYRFFEGDVLYSKIRPYLNKVVIAPYEGLCSADMYALKVKDGITSELLQAVLMSKRFLAYTERESGRASIPKVNRKTLLAYEIPKFTEVQIRENTKRLQAINRIRALKYHKLALLQELQRSLSARAFRGEL